MTPDQFESAAVMELISREQAALTAYGQVGRNPRHFRPAFLRYLWIWNRNPLVAALAFHLLRPTATVTLDSEAVISDHSNSIIASRVRSTAASSTLHLRPPLLDLAGLARFLRYMRQQRVGPHAAVSVATFLRMLPPARGAIQSREMLYVVEDISPFRAALLAAAIEARRPITLVRLTGLPVRSDWFDRDTDWLWSRAQVSPRARRSKFFGKTQRLLRVDALQAPLVRIGIATNAFYSENGLLTLVAMLRPFSSAPIAVRLHPRASPPEKGLSPHDAELVDSTEDLASFSAMLDVVICGNTGAIEQILSEGTPVAHAAQLDTGTMDCAYDVPSLGESLDLQAIRRHYAQKSQTP